MATYTTLSVGIVVVSVWACAQAAVDMSFLQNRASQLIMCKNQKNVRTIRVEQDKEDHQCIAVYTKAGIDREVGRAQSLTSCLRIIDNIKGNLEKANWKCKGHDKASMTSTNGNAN